MAPGCLEDAIAVLRHFNKNTPPPVEDAIASAEQAAFEELLKKEDGKVRRHPSYSSIPQFFSKKAFPPRDPHSLQGLVTRQARLECLERQAAESLLKAEDIRHITEVLEEHSVGATDQLDYQAFRNVRDVLGASGERYDSLLTAKTFLKLPKDSDGHLGSLCLMSYVIRKAELMHIRWKLAHYDMTGQGYLLERDLENFVFELIPELAQLRKLEEEFYPFYVFTAVRKFRDSCNVSTRADDPTN
eukprot:TRINITY_DN2566_c1_g1_i2.p1 TRINITY_DN2566_c1_g1~~TRINITY_DN2566_c1_g1_i2.p1  ORF type:complete len:244 (-),score=45.97 TRINITY_DN2566_c1_g1_i2:163-894(-)